MHGIPVLELVLQLRQGFGELWHERRVSSRYEVGRLHAPSFDFDVGALLKGKKTGAGAEESLLRV